MEQYMYTYDSCANNTADRYVPTSRFQVMNSVYLPAGDIDLRTGQLQPDRQRRCRTQAKRLEMERLDREERKLIESVAHESAKGGIRVSVRFMVVTMALLCFFCGIYILAQNGIVVDRQNAINRIQRSITDYRAQNADLESQIAEASDAAKICYAASQNLNMIPAAAADAIHLVAVDARPAVTAKENGSEQSQQPEIATVSTLTSSAGNGSANTVQTAAAGTASPGGTSMSSVSVSASTN